MNALNKKPCVLATREFQKVADKMSKAALIDLVYDYVLPSIGEESAPEMRLEALKQDANAVLRARSDRLIA